MPADLGAATETFSLGSTVLCADVAVGEDGTASCTTTALPVGTDDVTATFNFVPDPPEPFEGSIEVLAVTVNAAATVPVPGTGAGTTGLALPAALALVLGGVVAIAASRRLGREG
jgi:hypothetical protein